mmetsp:Transcript_14452/g.47193  ORF Transcript_14452/g.47193 Transcript_14452/m.47193 type:complete len:261 (+) Transcript_14452:131-913(+)
MHTAGAATQYTVLPSHTTCQPLPPTPDARDTNKPPIRLAWWPGTSPLHWHWHWQLATGSQQSASTPQPSDTHASRTPTSSTPTPPMPAASSPAPARPSGPALQVFRNCATGKGPHSKRSAQPKQSPPQPKQVLVIPDLRAPCLVRFLGSVLPCLVRQTRLHLRGSRLRRMPGTAQRGGSIVDRSPWLAGGCSRNLRSRPRVPQPCYISSWASVRPLRHHEFDSLRPLPARPSPKSRGKPTQQIRLVGGSTRRHEHNTAPA